MFYSSFRTLSTARESLVAVVGKNRARHVNLGPGLQHHLTETGVGWTSDPA